MLGSCAGASQRAGRGVRVYAILVLESSKETSGSLIKGLDPLHTVFPNDPLAENEAQVRF